MNIQLHDKTFIPFLGREQILQAITRMTATINVDYEGRQPIFLPVLDGAFIFAAELAKQLTIQAQFSFIKYKSYHNTQSTGQISQLLGLDIDITGKDIIVVEDIIDTGLTVSYLLQELKKHNPASIKVAALLTKPEALQTPLQIDYEGIQIPNNFIVGYGMDYNGLGRNLDGIWVVF